MPWGEEAARVASRFFFDRGNHRPSEGSHDTLLADLYAAMLADEDAWRREVNTVLELEELNDLPDDDELEELNDLADADPTRPRVDQRWEYTLLSASDLGPEELRTRLNELGAEGWELVATVGYQPLDSVVFKRPKTTVTSQ